MEAVISQLADFPWFVAGASRDSLEPLLAAPVVPLNSFVVRPCASRRALAISYKSPRGCVAATSPVLYLSIYLSISRSLASL